MWTSTPFELDWTRASNLVVGLSPSKEACPSSDPAYASGQPKHRSRLAVRKPLAKTALSVLRPIDYFPRAINLLELVRNLLGDGRAGGGEYLVCCNIHEQAAIQVFVENDGLVRALAREKVPVVDIDLYRPALRLQVLDLLRHPFQLSTCHDFG